MRSADYNRIFQGAGYLECFINLRNGIGATKEISDRIEYFFQRAAGGEQKTANDYSDELFQ